MYSKIVVGYDGQRPAQDALALAASLARATAGSLMLVYVTPEQPRWYRTERDYRRALSEDVQATLDPAFEKLPKGLDASKASIESRSPSRGLHDLASEGRATLLVLGSTHRGPIGRVLIGTTGELLLMGAPCAVMVAPRGYAERADDPLNVIAVGFDGSVESHGTLVSAHTLAAASRARLRVISVVESRGPFGHSPKRHESKDEHRDLEEQVDDAIEKLPDSLEIERSLLEGNPVELLASAAREADMLILGSRGYGPMHHVLLGSVSAKLMRSAPGPVLVVPRGARSPVEGMQAGVSTTGSGE